MAFVNLYFPGCARPAEQQKDAAPGQGKEEDFNPVFAAMMKSQGISQEKQQVAAPVIATPDNTTVEPAAAPEPAVEVEVAPAPAPAPAETSAPPSKWQSELEVFAGMGFTDEAVLVPLLEKHGSVIFAMPELLGPELLGHADADLALALRVQDEEALASAFRVQGAEGGGGALAGDFAHPVSIWNTDANGGAGKHVSVLATDAKLGLYADKNKWQLLNPRASTLAAITRIRRHIVPEEDIYNLRAFIFAIPKKRKLSIQPHLNGVGDALDLLRNLFHQADPASVNDLLTTAETVNSTKMTTPMTTRNQIILVPFAMLSETLLTAGYQTYLEKEQGGHTYTFAFGKSQEYICIELTPHEGKAPTSGHIPLHLTLADGQQLVLHSGILRPTANHFTAFVCHTDSKRCTLYDDSTVSETSVKEACSGKSIWVKMLVYGRKHCQSRPQTGIRQCAGRNSCYLAAPLIVLAAMDGIERCFTSDVHVKCDGSWKRKPGKGIFVIGPGATKNKAAYAHIPGKCQIFGNGFQYKPVYDSYSFTSLDELRAMAKVLKDKGLLTLILDMCEAIQKEPPEMIIAGSRGAKEVLPYLLEHCWRGPFVSLNAGPLLAPPQLPVQCTPCFVTYGADTLEPYSTCKTPEQVKLKFELNAEQYTNGLHVYLPDGGHNPTLPNFFFRDLYSFLQGNPLNSLRDLAAGAKVSLLHKASK